MPLLEVRACDIEPCSSGFTVNFTVCGESSKLWKASQTKATALIALGFETGTREG